MRVSLRRVTLVAILLMIAASCGGTGPGSTTPANPPTSAAPSPESSSTEAACADLQALGSSLDRLQALDVESGTREEYRQAWGEVVSAWDALNSSLPTGLSSSRERLESAYSDLREAVDDLPDDISVTEALTRIKPEADQFVADVRAAIDDLSCA